MSPGIAADGHAELEEELGALEQVADAEIELLGDAECPS